MSKQISKYQLYNNQGSTSISLKAGAKLLSVQNAFGNLWLYVLEDMTVMEYENRQIVMADEYQTISDGFLIYIGSITINDGTQTLHIFEDKGFG